MKKFYISLVAVLSLSIMGFRTAFAQGVLDPDDTLVTYNPNNPPATPPYGTVSKWVRTQRLNWNTKDWKAYYYNGIAFRVIFPKSYKANPSKKYPLLVFFHGEGEKGTIYDNELQLANCAQKIGDSVLKGTFDAFVVFPQSTYGGWAGTQFTTVAEFINYMIDNARVDRNRIVASGLSSGGDGAWRFIGAYPKLVAACVPISATNATEADAGFINTIKDIPIWLSQGGKDTNPSQAFTDNIVSILNNAGIDMRTVQPGEEGLGPVSEGYYIVYPNNGHNSWDAHFSEPLAFQYMLKAYKSNPHVYFGRREFCPGTPLNLKLEVTAGFDGYEWSRNGVVITGANTNSITVTDTGTYAARIKDGNNWSEWSPWPASITFKATTQTPPIKVSGLMSRVIPAPDGNTSVKLEEPAGYASYEWRNSSGQVMGTDRVFTASQPGNYTATVTEVYGCSANSSDSFYVASSTGPNPPDPAYGLTGYALSETSIQLNWSNNLQPVYNETAFEIYHATDKGGPFALAGIVPADSLSFADQNLVANTKYYYIVRAIDSTSAASPSDIDSVITLVDRQSPTAPRNLSVTATSENSVSLKWNTSTDNASIKNYYIYINGVKSYVTTDTAFTVYNLTHGNAYTFYVKATDPTGNISVASNQVVGVAAYQGLTYQYYTYTGSWQSLPDLGTLPVVKSGMVDNITLDPQTQSTNFVFSFQGYINIRRAGTYTFYTSSDDGSKLYINNTQVVSNDGLHGTTEKSGSYSFAQPGIYPFKVNYYQEGGGAVLTVSWQATSLGISKAQIPDSAFKESVTLGGTAPAMPTEITATALAYDSIKLTWSDNSTNETGFEIYRSASADGEYQIVGTSPANEASFIDTTVAPSTTYYYKVQAINQYGSSGFDLTSMGGLNYAYYESASFSTMPDFNSISPIKTGLLPNVTLAIKNKSTDYALKFAGTINIRTAGQYTFYTKSDDGSNLYVDGFDAGHLVVNNNYLQSPTERSGNVTLTAGIHPIYITFFQHTGGDDLEISYGGPGINKQSIPDSVFANGHNKATTFDLPAAPASPDSLSATAISQSVIKLMWNDRSDNETGFKIYRSVGNNGNYLLLKTVTANTTSYMDSALYANTAYYYKVAAVNVGGTSAFSNESTAVTQDNLPVLLSPDGDQSIQYDKTTSLNIEAQDQDNEPLTLSVQGLPSFGTFVDYGDGTGSLTFSPSQAQQGIYSGIKVKVVDQHGGADSSVFDLNVNANYQAPVITAAPSYTLVAGSSSEKTITAEYGDINDSLVWQATNLPSFVTYQAMNNGRQLLLNINPALSDVGHYNFTLTVSNSDGSLSSQQTVDLSIRATRIIYINFNDGTNIQTGNWNNTNTKYPNLNDTFLNMIDSGGNVTPVGLKVLTPWQQMGGGSNNSGATTGNNTGVYSDNVLKSAYWTNNTASQSIQVMGLDTSYTYDFTFLASRTGTGNLTTNYQIGSQSVSLNAANNTQNTVSINNVKPDVSGAVTVTFSSGAGSTYGYLNAMVIRGGVMPDQSAPSAPSGLAANYDSAHFVAVTWHDGSNNENGFQVFRRSSDSADSVLIGTVAANVASFNDSSVAGLTQYFYQVRAFNDYGYSPFAGPVQITTPNTPLVITPIGNVTIRQGDQDTIHVQAVGSVGSVITLSATDLPSFAQFIDQGNGQAVIYAHPDNTVEGDYLVTIQAADDKGNSSSLPFNIQVLNNNILTVNINFNGKMNVSAPWNNTGIANPKSGNVVAGLKDTNGFSTGIDLTFQENWLGSNTLGAVTGNNSGLYPDSVMQTSYWDNSTSDKHIVFSGLSAARRYTFAIFGSRSGGSGQTSIYSIGDQMDTLDVSNNVSQAVVFRDISPDTSGRITVSIGKPTNIMYSYLNAMVIQIYDSSLIMAPSNLIAISPSKNQISLKWTNNVNGLSGTEIWRSLSQNGTYSLIATTHGDTSAYVDEGLNSNTKYFYKIRSLRNADKSAYSEVASATTLLYSVYVNFSDDNLAPAPWNNVNTVPMGGNVFSLRDESGSNTGISMHDDGGFTAVNHSGTTTGNNSGVYPDYVMYRSYYVDGIDTGKLSLHGLNLSMTYNLTFFAGRTGTGDRTTQYIAQGKVVSLNASNNTTETVTIKDVTPDVNGNINIAITPGGSSAYAYIGALVIQAHNNYDDSGNIVYNQATYMFGPVNPLGLTNRKAYMNDSSSDLSYSLVSAYPNPFRQNVTIRLDCPADDKLTLRLFKNDGALVDQQEISVYKGANNLQYVLRSYVPPGLYILDIYSKATGKKIDIKLIKQ